MWNKIFGIATANKKNGAAIDLNVGDKGELAAQAFLVRQGLTLLEKNYRCKRGELDLIMQDQEYCVFVEVRLRKNSAFGSPAETVTYSKQQKLIAAAQHYLAAKELSEKVVCRFDVVSIIGDLNRNKNELTIDWLRNAFSA